MASITPTFNTSRRHPQHKMGISKEDLMPLEKEGAELDERS
ncbi:hypothetical protein Rifp1Sym_cf00120 [endosymbiont of Riftia pachyptila (vent Ph05)]|uniref:Uncharacterized protein n=2 Tax=sulfur-oxidizing symbionts TaxID=32036 RepID=G2FFU8_9GAMM|nr:hypothetical protein Rifp1Sym_cf00120 [endosymbiont of Riftia pachyptila (vent Ph05)]EGW54350.1 hypothetical protein TevJSym_an00570 [endosymbiont of Tevnia jerichonana (vent Tica)]